MRFMMLMIPNLPTGTDYMPTPEAVAKMMKYNEALTKAGVLLALDGLRPPSEAVRVTYAGGKPKVTDGPFAEAKEVVGGYWIIQTRTKEEAIEWATRVPADPGNVVEVRQIFEMTDFPPEVQKAAKL